LYYGDTGAQERDETFQRQKPYASYYEQTKTEAHEIAHGYLQRGLSLIIVCPSGVIGPNSNAPAGYFLRAYLNHLMTPCAWAPGSIQSLVHVQDAAEGIALAAEKGKIGETYLLAGEATDRRELFRFWMSKPGGFKVRFYIPIWLAKLMSAPLEPLERWMGMPTPIFRETISATSASNANSSAKAKRELGWTYRPAEQMWDDVIDGEIELLANRKKRDLLTRLKPVEMDA
jgi:dihydroflavonol-4-reductase